MNTEEHNIDNTVDNRHWFVIAKRYFLYPILACIGCLIFLHADLHIDVVFFYLLILEFVAFYDVTNSYVTAGVIQKKLLLPLTIILFLIASGVGADYFTMHTNSENIVRPYDYIIPATVLSMSLILLTILYYILRMADKSISEKQALLTESKERYRDIVGSLADWVWEIDSDGRYLYCSTRVKDILGYLPDEMIGIKMTEFALKDDAKIITAVLNHAGETSTAWNDTPIWYATRDGIFVCLQFSGVPRLDSQGQLIGFRGVFTDITEKKRAEDELHKSETLFRNLVVNQGEGIGILSTSNHFAFANPAADKIFGFKQGGLIGHRLSEFVDKKTADFLRLQTGLRRTGSIGRYEYVITRLDGQKRSLSVTASPQIGKSGKLIETLVVFRDVTDIKNAQAELHRSETKFRTLFNAGGDAIILMDENQLLDCNDATLGMFCLESKRDFLSRKPISLSPPTQPGGKHSITLHTEHILSVKDHGRLCFEWEFLRFDSHTTFPAEVLLTPMTLDGKLVFQVVVRDITSRKRRDAELRKAKEIAEKNEAFNRAIIDSHADAVITLDMEGKITVFNPAAERIFGYESSMMLGQSIDPLIPEVYLVRHTRAMSEYLENGELGDIIGKPREITAIRGDGIEFPIELTLTTSGQGKDRITIGVCRDITERKRAETELERHRYNLENLVKHRTAKLEQALENKDILFKEAHHRVKNNLQVLSSLAELYSDTIEMNEAVARIFETLQSRIRAMALVHEMLYRSDDLKHVDLGRYCKELCNQMAVSFQAVDRGIRLQVDSEPVYIELNLAISCGLIIDELVTNAFKHAFPQRGECDEIYVRVCRVDDLVTVEVRDNGIGGEASSGETTDAGIGKHVVEALTQEIEGQISFAQSGGMVAKLVFPIKMNLRELVG
ncbi:MAG: PAS domain S-box protein [Candidatus Zixiibacteriota bacterium]